jgi:hypothetical protein
MNRRESSIVPLAATLSGALSNTDGVREGIRQKEVYASIGAGLENGTLRPLVGHEMPLASASDALAGCEAWGLWKDCAGAVTNRKGFARSSFTSVSASPCCQLFTVGPTDRYLRLSAGMA